MILVGYTVEDGGQTLIYYFAWYSAGNQCWHRWIIEERAPRRSRMRRAMDPWLIGSTEQAPRIGVPMLLGEVAVEDGGRTELGVLREHRAPPRQVARTSLGLVPTPAEGASEG